MPEEGGDVREDVTMEAVGDRAGAGDAEKDSNNLGQNSRSTYLLRGRSKQCEKNAKIVIYVDLTHFPII